MDRFVDVNRIYGGWPFPGIHRSIYYINRAIPFRGSKKNKYYKFIRIEEKWIEVQLGPSLNREHNVPFWNSFIKGSSYNQYHKDIYAIIDQTQLERFSRSSPMIW